MHFVCAWFHNGHHHNWFYFQSNVIVVEKDAFGVVFLLLYVLVWPCRLELIFIIWVFNNIIFGLNVKNIFFIKKCFQNSYMCCSSKKGVYGFARSCKRIQVVLHPAPGLLLIHLYFWFEEKIIYKTIKRKDHFFDTQNIIIKTRHHFNIIKNTKIFKKFIYFSNACTTYKNKNKYCCY